MSETTSQTTNLTSGSSLSDGATFSGVITLNAPEKGAPNIPGTNAIAPKVTPPSSALKAWTAVIGTILCIVGLGFSIYKMWDSSGGEMILRLLPGLALVLISVCFFSIAKSLSDKEHSVQREYERMRVGFETAQKISSPNEKDAVYKKIALSLFDIDATN